MRNPLAYATYNDYPTKTKMINEITKIMPIKKCKLYRLTSEEIYKKYKEVMK